MAYLDELHQALIKADASGNTSDAKALADEIRKQQSPSSTPEQTQSFSENLFGVVKHLLPRLAIPGGAGSLLMDELGKGAYNLGGKASDAASSLGAPPELAAGIGTAANVGINAAPMVGGAAIGRTAGPAMRAGAEKMMGYALNPSPADAVSGKAARAAKTFLDEGLSPTVEGTQKLRQLGSDLNDQVYDLLAKSGKTINRPTVGAYIQDVVKRVESKEFSQDPIAAVERVYNQFLKNPLLNKDIPATQAQELKQGIYSELKKKYGVLGTDTEEAMKAVARGYKTELEKAVPEIVPKNARASDLWNALNVAERKAYIELNKTPGGFPVFLMHNPEAAMAYMASKSAHFKALVARSMNKGKTALPEIAGATSGAGYDLLKNIQE